MWLKVSTLPRLPLQLPLTRSKHIMALFQSFRPLFFVLACATTRCGRHKISREKPVQNPPTRCPWEIIRTKCCLEKRLLRTAFVSLSHWASRVYCVSVSHPPPKQRHYWTSYLTETHYVTHLENSWGNPPSINEFPLGWVLTFWTCWLLTMTPHRWITWVFPTRSVSSRCNSLASWDACARCLRETRELTKLAVYL